MKGWVTRKNWSALLLAFKILFLYWKIRGLGERFKPLLFSHWVIFNPLWPHGLHHTRIPCASLSPRVCSNLCPWSWCYPTTSSSVTIFSSCPQSFPVSGSLPVSKLFASGGQSIGASASASVLPMNSQDWFHLEWTGLISLLSKGLSRVFSNTTVQKYQFFCTPPLYSPTLTSIPNYWKNHSFDWTELCWQSDVSVF